MSQVFQIDTQLANKASIDVDEYVVTESQDRTSSQQINAVYSDKLLDANQTPYGNAQDSETIQKYQGKVDFLKLPN